MVRVQKKKVIYTSKEYEVIENKRKFILQEILFVKLFSINIRTNFFQYGLIIIFSPIDKKIFNFS